MSFMDAVKTCYSKYATFEGRAARPEYWWFVLWTFLPSVVLYALLFIAGMSSDGSFNGLGTILLLLVAVWALANVIPAISVAVRRLHDTDRSGWWYWIQLIPCGIGFVWFLVLMIQDGTATSNQYGAREGAAAA